MQGVLLVSLFRTACLVLLDELVPVEFRTMLFEPHYTERLILSVVPNREFLIQRLCLFYIVPHLYRVFQ